MTTAYNSSRIESKKRKIITITWQELLRMANILGLDLEELKKKECSGRMKSVKMLAYQKTGDWDSITYYQTITEDDITAVNWDDENNEWKEDSDGEFTAVRVYNGRGYELFVDHEHSCDVFEIFDSEIETIKVDDSTGYDKVKFIDKDGEERIGHFSRWQGDAGSIIIESEEC